MFLRDLPTGSRRLPLCLVAAFSLFHAGIAGAQQTSDNTSHKNFFSDWLGQSYGASYKWFGLEAPMKTYGFSVKGDMKEAYFGQVSGGLPNQPLSNWCFDMKLKGTLELEKLFPVFSGWSISSYWRYRTGGNPRWAAGTPNFIAPSNMPNGAELWNLSQMLEYSSKKKELYFNIGWENPYEQFLQQPLSKIFENQAISTSKGIGANAGPGIVVTNPSRTSSYAYRTSPVPWGNTFGAWGTTLRIKPRKNCYIQSGLYWANSNMGGPNPTQFLPNNVYPYNSTPSSYLGKFRSSGQVVPVVNGKGQQTSRTQNLGWVPGIANNHGFGGMGGSTPFNPQTQNIGVPGADVGNGGNYSQNGLFNVNEIGCSTKLGKDGLEGKYAFGSYVWGNNNSQFTPVAFTTDGYGAKKPVSTQVSPVIWGLYFQADQQLYAEKGKNYQTDQVSMHGKVSKQGLYSFNEFTYTPPNGCQVPYYFQTGLVYKGLIPTRDNDMIGVCLGCAIYSDQYNQWIDSQNQALQNNYGSTYNATVPNGPTQYYPINPNTGAPNSRLQDAYAYQPHFSSTQIIEACYDIQLTKWANFKPFVEYIINPAGNGTVPNVVILGASSKWFF
ncbi:MAG: carbohydrate porin [Chthoniobacterales bacterium]